MPYRLPSSAPVAGLMSLLALVAFGGNSLTGLHAQTFDSGRSALPAQSERRVSYTMKVHLEPDAKRLRGSQTIVYRNRTSRATNELRFHLYLNAFRNVRSTHLREESAKARKRYEGEEEFGSIRFLELKVKPPESQAVDLMSGLRYIQPDDDNSDDRTVAMIPLAQSFAPGTELVIETEFVADLPKAYRRTGWGPGNFFMIAQWFPKLGVLQEPPSGAASDAPAEWYCHQFHAHTEFFADFGSYDVTIDTPKGWPLGATGKQVGESTIEGNREIRRFVQEDVHDFAWVTDPDYRVHEWEFAGDTRPADPVAGILKKELALSDDALRLGSVHVRMLLHPEHDSPEQVGRHRRAIEESLRFFGTRFGAYPYETLTVVDPCTDKGWERLGGGMEYPTLITCGTRYLLHPQRLQPEGVTVHEFGHQFWYGLSANNEPEEPWLDEGVNSYSEGRTQDLAYATPLRVASPGSNVGNPILTTTFGPFVYGGVAPGRFVARGPKGWNSVATLERLPVEDWLVSGLSIAGVDGKKVHDLFDKAKFDGTLFGKTPILQAARELPFLSYEERSFRNLWNDRLGYLAAPTKDVVRTAAWKFLDRQSYRTNSYPRPATILATLERMMGPEKWWPCMRRFHERARFAHPTGDDFVATVREFGGDEIGDFAREALTTAKLLDYGIERVDHGDEPERTGRFDDDERSDTRKQARVFVRNFGELRAPVSVRFTFADGSTIEDVWTLAQQRERRAPWKSWTFDQDVLAQRGGELDRVDVDPPNTAFEVGEAPVGKLVLDANLLNNGWTRAVDAKPAKRRTLRLWLWFESVLGYFGAIG
ncbi:MAG: M1 family metallopeptidase [Planctomycetes bacterium]|nr:M1 family metallopeptidase [Planctomycetota bacterium]